MPVARRSCLLGVSFFRSSMINHSTSPENAKRTVAVYRRWFAEPADTDFSLIARCYQHLSKGAIALLLLNFMAIRIYTHGDVVGAGLAIVVCCSVAGFFWLCARQLRGVRQLLERSGCQNLSDVHQ